MMLNKWERNKLYEVILKSKIDPAEFDLEDTGSKVVISHNSGSTFEFSLNPTTPRDLVERVQASMRQYSHKYSRYLYRYNVQEGVDQAGTADSISLLEPYISRWLDEIWYTFGVPDYWQELQRSRELIDDIQWSGVGNTPFTSDERRQIVAELETIKEQVKEQFDLTSEQAAHIDEWKDEVADASERVGRKDWRLLVYGTIVNLVVTDALPPEVARHILSMFIHLIVQLFGGSGPTGILT
ncbi:MAG TPA: hypothetical protein VGR71_17595 [Nitrospira sp.]|nr:hypothetical protein [Nitrospira sp.]